MKNFLKLLASIIVCHAAGIIGSVFTTPAIPNWYANLTKPAFNPPNWIFAPVWLTLYTLMGVALFLIWQKKPVNKFAISFFLVHLVFNASWSIVFFGLNNIALALANIIIILAMIVILIWKFWSIKKTAAILLIPYLFWVSFATVLNLSIWLLN